MSNSEEEKKTSEGESQEKRNLALSAPNKVIKDALMGRKLVEETLGSINLQEVRKGVQLANEMAKNVSPLLEDIKKRRLEINLNFEPYRKALFSMQEMLNQSLAASPILNLAKAIAAHNDEINRRWRELIQNRVFGFVPRLNEALQVVLSPLREYARRMKEEEEALDALSSAGLFIAPSMDGELLEKIKKYHRAKKRRSIVPLVLRFYRKNDHSKLREIVKGFEENAFFRPRLTLIRDALEAHFGKKYTLSIPTLLPQVEGIITVFVLSSNLSAKPHRKEGMLEALSQAPAGFDVMTIYKGVTRYFDKVVYKGKDFKRISLRNKERLNRHLILHGRQVNYATEINSLRVFLLLDCLSILLYEAQYYDMKPKRKSREAK